LARRYGVASKGINQESYRPGVVAQGEEFAAAGERELKRERFVCA
jgi:hypothetical protein